MRGWTPRLVDCRKGPEGGKKTGEDFDDKDWFVVCVRNRTMDVVIPMTFPKVMAT